MLDFQTTVQPNQQQQHQTPQSVMISSNNPNQHTDLNTFNTNATPEINDDFSWYHQINPQQQQQQNDQYFTQIPQQQQQSQLNNNIMQPQQPQQQQMPQGMPQHQHMNHMVNMMPPPVQQQHVMPVTGNNMANSSAVKPHTKAVKAGKSPNSKTTNNTVNDRK